MKKIKWFIYTLALAVLVSCSSKKDDPVPNEEPIADLFDREHKNPFVTDNFMADPSAHVWADGRLYVYPSHDISPPRGCDLMDQYHVYSTDDMVHWTDHGAVSYTHLTLPTSDLV